jgi:hypothetical protein
MRLSVQRNTRPNGVIQAKLVDLDSPIDTQVHYVVLETKECHTEEDFLRYKTNVLSAAQESSPPADPPTPRDLRKAALEVPSYQFEIVPESMQRRRDERVRQAVLARAGGRSEWSGEEFPYLTVHHIEAVADGGVDSIFNAIVLTPNEHAIADREPAFNDQLRQRLFEIEPNDADIPYGRRIA